MTHWRRFFLIASMFACLISLTYLGSLLVHDIGPTPLITLVLVFVLYFAWRLA